MDATYIVFVVVVFATAYAAGYALQTYKKRRDQSTDPSEIGSHINYLRYYTQVVLVGLVLIGHWSAKEQWLATDIGASIGIPQQYNVYIIGLPLMLTFCAAYAGLTYSLWPTVQQLSGSETTVRQRLIKGVGSIGAVYIAGSVWHLVVANTVPMYVGVVVTPIFIIILLYLSTHKLMLLGRDARAPTEAEQSRINQVCDEVGIEIDEIFVCQTDSFTGAVWIVERFGNKRSTILSSLLESATDEELKVALAEADGRRKYVERYNIIGIAIIATYLPTCVYALLTLEPNLSALPPDKRIFVIIFTLVSPLVVFIAYRIAQKRNSEIYRVDRSISKIFGYDTVIQTYKQHGKVLFSSGPDLNEREFLHPMPPTQNRIKRLNHQSEYDD